jgi:hypothetical protein
VNKTAPGVEFLVWTEDFGSQFVPIQCSVEGSEIRREKPTLASDGMALRTLCLSEEEYPASFRISWQRQDLASALQGSEVSDHRRQFADPQRRERWHPASWFSIRQDLPKLRVRFKHNLGP